MDAFEQKIQLILLIAGTVAAVLAVVVPFLTLHWQLCSKIHQLEEEVGALDIDHQKTLLVRDAKIAELERARTVLISKARYDTERFRALERRLKMLEAQSARRPSPIARYH